MARTATQKAKPSAVEMLGRIKSTVEDADLVERRRRQITAAAIHEFIRLGFHPATIKDVAARAQVSVGLIYQYVGDKEDLLFLALVEILQDYKRQIPPALAGITDPLQRFATAVTAYCHVHNASPDATVLAYRETASLGRQRRNVVKQLEIETNELIAACVRDCIAAGVFEPIDVDLFTYQLVMFSHTWALKSWTLAARMTVDEYIERGLALMLQGVMSAKGQRQARRLTPGLTAALGR